jgi:CRISPR system Cascade subunit CasE
MWFSRVRLNPRAAEQREFWNRILNAYHAHSLIWDLFSEDPDQERDFLFRQDMISGLPIFYTVSERPPNDRKGMWVVESKPYVPKISLNQNFSFMLRANPVRTKRDENHRQHRHDVVMEAKTILKMRGIPRESWPSEAQIVQEAGYAWLAMKGEKFGFTIPENGVRVDGYIQQEFANTTKGKRIRISTIDFSGALTVTNTEKFLASLMKGIGPAMGFGYGLLLIKPIRPAG